MRRIEISLVSGGFDSKQKGIFMKSKKITVIISYDYEDKNTVSNDRIADRVKNDLLKGSNPNHEKIESVTVEDN